MNFKSKLKCTASSLALISAVIIPNVVEASNSPKLSIEGNTKVSSSSMSNFMLQGISEVEITGVPDSKGKMQKPTFTLNSAMFKDTVLGAEYYYSPRTKIYTHGVSATPYANQIDGNITIENATFIVNKELAANNINVNTGGTLTTNALIYTNLNVDGYKAKATINGKNKYMQLKDVSVTNGGSLTFNNVDHISANRIEVEDGTLNYTEKGSDFDTPEISLQRGTLNATNWIIAHGRDVWINEGSKVKLNNGILSTSSLHIANSDPDADRNVITLSKDSILNGTKYADISSANVTLNNNSKIGSMKDAIYKDAKGVIYGFGPSSYEDVSNTDISDANITLNGSSSIENSLVIMQDTKSDYSKISDILTPDKITDNAIAKMKRVDPISNDDLVNLRNRVEDVRGEISVSNSNITMNGTSQIANRLWNDNANIEFRDASTLTVNGNNKLVAGGSVGMYSSSVLEIANGAKLTVESHNATENAGKDLYMESSTLKLLGTLNANISGKIDTLILGKSGKVNGTVELRDNITNLGVSGVKSEKDFNSLYNSLTNWGNLSAERFLITDKSNITLTGVMSNQLGFNDLTIDNNSTLNTKANDTLSISGKLLVDNKSTFSTQKNSTLNMEDKLLVDNGSTLNIKDGTVVNTTEEISVENKSTLNISSGANVTAGAIHTHASSVNINGSELKKGQTEYQTKINAEYFAIGNIDNPKATVNIKNAEINVGNQLEIVNTKAVNMTNVDVNADLMIGSFGVEQVKGKDVYNTATLTNVKVDGNINTENTKLVIKDNVKADRLVTSISAYLDRGKTYIDVQGKNVNITNTDLQEDATLSVASGKTYNSNITMDAGSTILLKGNLNGSINGVGNISSLDIQNKDSKVNAAIKGITLAFNKVTTKISSMFKGSTFDNLTGLDLISSTITADRNDMGNVGDLFAYKSTLTLKNDLQANNADIYASKLYLGTNTLEFDGNVDIYGKSSIYLNVDDAYTYGSIKADTINLLDNTTSLAVTLKKGVDLSNNDGFTFLDYNEVYGKLGSVTVANNRYKFTEVDVGQFIAEETLSGKGVIKRYDASRQNLAMAARFLVDNPSVVTNTSETLNTLSQVVGGEAVYASSLATVNADDTGIALSSSNEISKTTTNAALGQMTSGSNLATQGMSLGTKNDRGSVWTKVLYNHSELDANSKYEGFTGNTTGLAFGADKMVASNVKAGIGYGYTESRIKNDIRTTDVDTHTLMLYGEYKPSKWFVNGVASFGWSDYAQNASNGVVSVNSDFDVYATSLLLNTGYETKVGNSTTVTPYVGMRYLNVVQDDYVDSDDKQISTDNSDLLTLTAATKVKTDYVVNENTTITPEVRFGLTYDVLSDSGNSIVSLSNGASYEVKTRRLDRFGVEFGAGVSASVNDNWEVTAGYEGKFKEDYQDHTGTFDVRYNF